jgi:large subunit ribosomal protein L11
MSVEKKDSVSFIKLQIPAGSATPAPPVGSALGQKGVNIMAFCKEFNAATQDKEKGSPIPVTIKVFEDKSFSFEMKSPPASWFILKKTNKKKGSSNPGRETAGEISMESIVAIAHEKKGDLNVIGDSIDSAVKIIAGSARSMGIEVLNYQDFLDGNFDCGKVKVGG